MKGVQLLIITAFASLIFSCSETKIDARASTNLPESDNRILINEPGYEMALDVPIEYLSNHKAKVEFNDKIGLLEVALGEKFLMEISDIEMDIDEFKEALKREQMFKYKISNEDPSGFVFQSFLPDGTEFSTNFIQKFELDGKVYTAKSKKGNEFNLDQIMKMKQAISTVKTI